MSDYNRRYRPMPFPVNQSAQTLTFSARELKEMIECYLRNKGQIVSVGDFDVDPVKLTVTVVNYISPIS